MILVTGATGHVGGELVRRPAASGGDHGAEVLGRPARTFAEWAAAHAGAFGR
ncbi:hypothetical protein ACWC09_13795 [Streptomyces sp. NPDC001617]